MANTLDRAGLGPADFLYYPIKDALRSHRGGQKRIKRVPRINVLTLSFLDPPHVPDVRGCAPILFGSSYHVSANFMRWVAASMQPGEALLYEASQTAARSFRQWFVDMRRSVSVFGDAVIYAARVLRVLKRAGFSRGERNGVAAEAIRHTLYRAAARAVLDQSKAAWVVIGNANRRFEMALWCEAKTRGLSTALMPYSEINMQTPARAFSLCRGAFDLAFPFSEYSGTQLRSLCPHMSVVVAGYPRRDARRAEASGNGSRTRVVDVLYLSGISAERQAVPMLRSALEDYAGLRLRLRLHPRLYVRTKPAEREELYGWLATDQISDPAEVDLLDDIVASELAITVWSTTALDTMRAGVPLIWLVPERLSAAAESSPLYLQGLPVLIARTAPELRRLVAHLLNSRGERQRVVDKQWLKMRELGLDKDYLATVKFELRRHAGLC